MKKRSLPVRFTGQHFTIDTILIKDAIRLADVQKEDIVLDIGAGSGFLTIHLVKHSKSVIAIENDRRLVSELQSKFRTTDNIVIVGMDYRKFLSPQKSFKVVSNIPFALTSEILKSLMYSNIEFFKKGCLIMQLETAQKLVSKKYFNPYTVFYHTFFDVGIIYEINPKSFLPPPTVTSALVKISKKKCINNISVEMKEKYLSFLHFMMKFPDLPLKTVLKKLFRKQQVRYLASSYDLELDKPVSSLSPAQFLRCFIEMLRFVPIDYHPNHI
ncbi:23S ribosomal RNA methyltransferase Erm [Sphingobacterium faecale]|uniref:Methyltransferase domain-containing protein n=1 Tax=Sphingobacterium faecale TaxID=2803775 RepID=A0ABS1R5D6_9SPHI|nr:rRNA adenine N-6-methyltransferase family protein [Sphingobacterium faecale]MBL1409921.1 methyltransferase domain-containing protein [Sphingobacterium faecale]